ncbi:MAG TPA: AlkA N-terminal domain-containing protein [Chroococcales cyanobacterium]
MKADLDRYYQALQAHDPRFDGIFFVAVKSTKIYCRPICPAKVPMQRNCTFYPTAAAAEQAGYRPCLRCRPELAPGNSRVDAMNRLSGLIAQQIEDGFLDNGSVADLAQEIGISERHLRRVVESEFGVSPLDLAQTARLLTAKRLLTDTNLPVTEVAYISGFASLRRFNSVFKERYNLSPSQLRKNSRSTEEIDVVRYALGFRPPFDWPSLLQFLSARSVSGVEIVDHERYIRTVKTVKGAGWIEVFLTPEVSAQNRRKPKSQEHSVTVCVSLALSRSITQILRKVRQLFDLDANPLVIEQHLGALAKPRPGLRVPGAFDNFELAVRAILGQQVSVKGATTLMARYVAAYGESIETPFEGLNRLTPAAETIAAQCPADVAATIGIPLKRATTIVELATAIANKSLKLDHLTDVDQVIQRLEEIPGIGSWTAQYIAMRALRWPDAFPHGDLGIRKAMQETNSTRLIAASESWRPWRAYAAMHLWKSLPVAVK